MKRVIIAVLTKDADELSIGEVAHGDLKVDSIQYRQNGLDKINVGTPGYLVEMSSPADEENISASAFIPEREVKRLVFVEEKSKKVAAPEVESVE